ncbi:MFS general substrate transporter [Meredithblackwellia eburnea MCA 4105]
MSTVPSPALGSPTRTTSMRRSSSSGRLRSQDTSSDHSGGGWSPTQDDDATLAERARREPEARADGKIELSEIDCYEKLGFHFSTRKKWSILTVIFVIQCSMNLNASLYANAVPLLSNHFDISEQSARIGQAIFLIAYAFGSELWAPWSEELGRWPILQASLFFVNLWQIPCALAPNFATIVVGRFLGGLSSAGGSVTLGMVGDMWSPEEQGFAVAYVVLSSVGGSVIGPVVGGFIQAHLTWHWNFWLQLFFGAATQLAHFCFVPETRATVILDREAKKRRKAGQTNIFGPGELKQHKMELKDILDIWGRPFVMFVREPIVLWLSLLSGFSDSLIFTFLESYTPVFSQWRFTVQQIGLAFLPLLVGYIIAWTSFFPTIINQRKARRRDPDSVSPEARLWWLLYTAPLLPIGLFGFAWTSVGPPRVHWIAPMSFSVLIAIANYSVYMATIDYMVASYGPYAASATGGNALARDLLAGAAAMYSTPFYSNIPGRYKLEWPTTILAILATLFIIPVYVFYFNGPYFRSKSKFAVSLASEKKQNGGILSLSKSANASDIEEKHVE